MKLNQKRILRTALNREYIVPNALNREEVATRAGFIAAIEQ